MFSRVQPFDGVKRLINSVQAECLAKQWSEFDKLKQVASRLEHTSPVMHLYLSDLRDGRRGLSNLHPATIVECAERMRRFGWENWVDPPALYFDPAMIVDIMIEMTTSDDGSHVRPSIVAYSLA